MIQGVKIRELAVCPDDAGVRVSLWDGENAPPPEMVGTARSLLPGRVEAWFHNRQGDMRLICLRGMIKAVLYDLRGGSSAGEGFMEVYAGEYRYREIVVPPGVAAGWKAVGNEPALLLVLGEKGKGEPEPVSIGIPYSWEVVMR